MLERQVISGTPIKSRGARPNGSRGHAAACNCNRGFVHDRPIRQQRLSKSRPSILAFTLVLALAVGGRPSGAQHGDAPPSSATSKSEVVHHPAGALGVPALPHIPP